MVEYHLAGPLKDEDVEKLRIGDTVYISGECFTCRSRLQKYIFDEGNALPFSTGERNILIHNGPIVIKEDGNWKLVSFMPTLALSSFIAFINPSSFSSSLSPLIPR